MLRSRVMALDSIATLTQFRRAHYVHVSYHYGWSKELKSLCAFMRTVICVDVECSLVRCVSGGMEHINIAFLCGIS